MFDCPPNLSYSHRHLWVDTDEKEGIATVGITEDLAEELDEILSIDLPMKDDELEIDAMCMHLHLSTEIYHIRSPLSGRVVEINRDTLDNPNLLHLAPYENWLIKMEYDESEEFELLMNANQYMSFLDQL